MFQLLICSPMAASIYILMLLFLIHPPPKTRPKTMKPTPSLPFFFFLLIAFTTTTTAEVLIDTDGDVVRNGGRYYLNPNSHVRGSGIIFSPIMHADSSCTLAVVDDPFNGGRETFISSPLRIGILSTNIRLNLSFSDLPSNICSDKANWVVTRPSLPAGNPVMVGSAEEFGDAFVHGWFFIKSVKVVSERHYYKLVFCEEEKECKDVGVFVDGENQRRLVVTDDNEPLVFTIRKEWRRSFASDLSTLV